MRAAFVAVIAALVMLGALSAPATAEPDVPTWIENAAGEAVAFEELIAVLAEADIVVLGEVHDNPAHHALQAGIVAALAAAPPGVTGLAFEMIPEAREEAVNTARAAGADANELAEAIRWSDLGWPDFALYAPIFTAAPSARITGGQPARAELMRLAQEGAGSDPLAAKFGLDQPLPPEQQARRESLQIEAHCNAMPAEMAPMLVTAQRVRDAHFAEATLRAHAAGAGRAVLITGTGHAKLDDGVPALLEHAAPSLTVISVGMSERAVDQDASAAREPFDYVAYSAPHVREDPCLVFTKRK